MKVSLSQVSLWFFLLCSVSSAVEEKYPYPKTKRVMINAKVLAECMAGSIEKDGKQFTLEPWVMYPNNFKNRSGLDSCIFNRSNFFSYLTIAPDRQCDFETGNEPRLRDWVLNQNENSIDPLSLFRSSLKLNSGNAFNALLTIHQLLRNEARWFSKKYYEYDSSEEKANAFWSKFVDIRGDLAEAGQHNEGDHRGSWYRIWGMMMYRLNMTEINRLQDDGQSCSRSQPGFFSKQWADMKSSGTAISAELVKYIFDVYGDGYKAGGDRAGKSRINSAGSQTASYLADSLDSKQVLDPDSSDCSSSKILLNSLF